MKRSTIRSLLAAAVPAAMLVIAPAGARAQFQVDNSRVNDASNRIGSGGYNSGGIPAPETVNGNQIVTGNVTGGQSFRGNVGYTAPSEFRGQTGGVTSDRFIRDSSGAPTGFGGQQGATNFARPGTAYYGASQTVTPPAGYVAAPNNAGYVPAQAMAADNRIGTLRFDERLGVMTNVNDVILPQPGQLILPGPVDPTANTRTYIGASPLYGIRQFNTADPSAAGIYNQIAMNRSLSGQQRLSDEEVFRMRQELGQTLNTSDLNGGPLGAPGSESQPNQQQQSPDQLKSGLLQSQIQSKPIADALTSKDLTANNRLLATPEQQSAQYAEMRKRFEKFYPTPKGPAAVAEKTPEEINREKRNQLAVEQIKEADAAREREKQTVDVKSVVPDFAKQAREAAEGKNQPPAKPRLAPGQLTTAIPFEPGVGPTGTGDRPEPVEVTSLATGVQAPGLRSLLINAEKYMRAGKFDSAISEYEQASLVAPNNPLMLLGQANAELGGEYFARAENHLRQAFLLDPTLLVARYDLRGMLGDTRFEQIVESLKGIANREQDQARPAFLLAYVAYNSHDSDRAASYLDLAEKRTAGGRDPVYQILRSHWDLPRTTTRPAADLNK